MGDGLIKRDPTSMGPTTQAAILKAEQNRPKLRVVVSTQLSLGPASRRGTGPLSERFR
jgi:hypothetical protein